MENIGFDAAKGTSDTIDNDLSESLIIENFEQELHDIFLVS